MLINARSIKNKCCQIHDLIIDKSLDALFITETWVSQYDSASIAAILPDSHEFYSVPREEGRGGGIGLVISKDIQSVKSRKWEFDSFECMEVKLYHNNRNSLFYIVYRPPQIVGLPRDQNKANFNKLRQIAKFGMIVYYKIVINNLI